MNKKLKVNNKNNTREFLVNTQFNIITDSYIYEFENISIN